MFVTVISSLVAPSSCFFLVECRPVSIQTLGGCPVCVRVLEPFAGEDLCLMFVSIGCRTCFVGWYTFLAKWFCKAALFGSCGGS